MEISQLKSAIQILNQFDGMPQFEGLNEILVKLQQGILLARNENVAMSFDGNQYLKGIEHLGILFNAILYKKPLRIQYQDFKAEHSYEIILHPYHLKQFNNRWFLFGFNPVRRKYDWNLALDRIITITELSELFHQNHIINWREYFDEIIGVTKPDGETISKIRLIFKGATCHYVVTKPLHGSQKIKWVDESQLEVTIEVLINFELEKLILSYGENVKVIAPESLVTSVKNQLAKSLDQYQLKI